MVLFQTMGQPDWRRLLFNLSGAFASVANCHQHRGQALALQQLAGHAGTLLRDFDSFGAVLRPWLLCHCGTHFYAARLATKIAWHILKKKRPYQEN